MSYIARVAKNILPLSIAQSLPAAFAEWESDNTLVDRGWRCGVCELCEQEDLRWHFGIQNRQTVNRLQIGSKCILRFSITVRDEHGRRIAPERAEAHLNGMVRRMQREDCQRALRAVAETNPGNAALNGAVERFEDKGSLTPRQAVFAFVCLAAHGIEHRPDYFTVDMRRGKYRRDLVTMNAAEIALLWPALTTAQRERANGWGIVGPAPAPVRRMTPKAKPWPYAKWVAVGWSDAELVAHGYMQMS